MSDIESQILTLRRQFRTDVQAIENTRMYRWFGLRSRKFRDCLWDYYYGIARISITPLATSREMQLILAEYPKCAMHRTFAECCEDIRDNPVFWK